MTPTHFETQKSFKIAYNYDTDPDEFQLNIIREFFDAELSLFDQL